MKKPLFLLLLSIFATTTLNAQITMRETSVIEKPILKPEPFDSLTNLGEQSRPIDYKKFIGHKLFLLPNSKTYKREALSREERYDFLVQNKTTVLKTKPKSIGKSLLGGSISIKGERYETNIYCPQIDEKGVITTIPDSIEGKYFTILDIKGKFYTDKEYKKLEDIVINENNRRIHQLEIKLRNEANKDTLTWLANTQTLDYDFFLVPFFEKQRSLYLNKNLVLAPTNYSSSLKDLVDINTGALVDIKPKEVWTCTDISFIDSKNYSKMSCFAFLKNGEREIKISLEENKGQSKISRLFMLESDFKQQELENQKNAEVRKREELELEKKAKLKEQQFRKDCITKWGQKMGTYVADRKVVIGMNKEMCIAAWGEPIDINKTIARGISTEQWVYGLGTYLYFDKGLLTAIQN